MKRSTLALLTALVLAGPARADLATTLQYPVPVSAGGTGCTAPTTACANAIGAAGLGANTDITSLGGLTSTIPSTALPIATTSALGAIKPDGTTITVNPSTGVASASGGGGGGAVTSVGTGFGLTGGPITTTGTISVSTSINARTTTSYTIAATDAWKLITFSNASAVAVTLPQAGTTGFAAGFGFYAENLGAGTVTVTPTTSTVNGSATLVLKQNTGCTVVSDGTNYQVSGCSSVAPFGAGTVTSVATGCGLSGGTITSSGTFAATLTPSAVAGASNVMTSSSCGTYEARSNAGSAMTDTLPSSAVGYWVRLADVDATAPEVISTPSGVIKGPGSSSATSLTLSPGQDVLFTSDGTNYYVANADQVASGSTNQLAYYAAGHSIAGLSGSANSVLSTNGSSIPVWSTALPNGVMATTQSAGCADSSTDLATDAFVFDCLGGGGAVYAPVFTAATLTSTASPTMAAGDLALNAGLPLTMSANGEATASAASTADGLFLAGKGSTYDVALGNSTGSASNVACGVPTGTLNLQCQGYVGLTAVSAPSVPAIWYDTTRKTLGSYENGTVTYKSGILYISPGVPSGSTGTTPFNLLGTGGTGTQTLPANFMVLNKTIRITISGVYQSTASPGTIQFAATLGGTTVAQTPAVSVPASMTNAPFELKVILSAITFPSTSGGINGLIIPYAGNSFFGANLGLWTTFVNTTVPQTIGVTSTNSVNNGDVILSYSVIIEALG